MPKSYQPGHRRKDLGENMTADGPKRYSDSRYAWVRTEVGQFVILVGDQSNEVGTDVVLYHPRPGNQRAVSIVLTSLTEQELDALEDLFKSAFEWARPVVKQRDQEAEDAWQQGDDSVPRHYRPDAQLVYRKRPQPEHGEELHERSTTVPEGGRRGPDFDGGVRGTGDELAEPHSGSSVTQDDGSETD